MKYEPKFRLTSRDGKTALWVTLPSGEKNIWDLDDDLVTESVLKAIVSSFYRGLEAQYQVFQKTSIKQTWPLQKWEDKRPEPV